MRNQHRMHRVPSRTVLSGAPCHRDISGSEFSASPIDVRCPTPPTHSSALTVLDQLRIRVQTRTCPRRVSRQDCAGYELAQCGLLPSILSLCAPCEMTMIKMSHITI